MRIIYLCFLFCTLTAFAEEKFVELLSDLDNVKRIDIEKMESLPFLQNDLLQGGYFFSPSARQAHSGVAALGVSTVPSFQIYNAFFQYFDRVEMSFNYWVGRGKKETREAIRTLNTKISLLKKMEEFPYLPEVAIGFNDFLGTKGFYSFFVVSTYSFLPANLEMSLGWGKGKIRGFFGGVGYTPFRNASHFLKGVTLAVEYDANKESLAFLKEAKKNDLPFNGGLFFRWKDFLQVAFHSVGTKGWGGSIRADYDFSNPSGLFPKVDEPSVYLAPINREPFGPFRSKQAFAHEMAYALEEEGLDLYSLYFTPKQGGKGNLWMKVINSRYRKEEEIRERLQAAFFSLLPKEIEKVEVVTEVDGVALQQYSFRREAIEKVGENRMSPATLAIISPAMDVKPRKREGESLLFQRKRKIWTFTFQPVLRTYFGSSTGKIKFDTGLQGGLEGYLFNQVFYQIQSSYTALASKQSFDRCDVINPSPIFNVRSDTLSYYQSSSFHLDKGFVQRGQNLSRALFGRVAVGYFERAYAGVAAELLYYPIKGSWAVGLEGAFVMKRKYSGLGWQRKVQKFVGDCPVFVPFYGVQYFFDLYYRYEGLKLDFTLSLGQFLAKDKGVRFEMGRQFGSGAHLSFWFAATSANDRVNNHRYYEKGFSFSLPLDFFMKKSSQTRVGYTMAAWLRDGAAKAETGKPLYPLLFYQREDL